MLALLAATASVAGAERGAPAERGAAQVRVARGLLSADVASEPLARVLRRIALESGVAISVFGRVDRPITVSFADVPLEEGLRRILRAESVAFVYAPARDPEAPSLLARVIVLGGSLPAASGATPTDAGAVTTFEPAGAVGDSPVRASRPGGASGDGRPSSGEAADEAAGTLVSLQDRVRQGDRTAVAELKRLLKDARDLLVRTQSAALLGIASGEDAAAALESVLADADPALRLHAVRALGQIGGRNATPLLKEVLHQDPDPRVRRMAVRWLGAFATVDARAARHAAARTPTSRSAARKLALRQRAR